jgi:hypothetical protein
VATHPRRDFWQGFLALGQKQSLLFAGHRPLDDNYVSFSVGVGWLQYQCVIRRKWGDVHLYIDNLQKDSDLNRMVFEALYADREAIEAKFGGPLEWDYNAHRRSQYVRIRLTSGGLAGNWTWPQLQADMVEALIRMDQVLTPRLRQLERVAMSEDGR